uniref:Uncharacterized protein n=1 Tax=Leersia perrieri TaxID=77586 RepID=A0A0D9WVR8_9ORYZ
MWGKGESFAERISVERVEAVGDTVGYKFRLFNNGLRLNFAATNEIDNFFQIKSAGLHDGKCPRRQETEKQTI